MSKKFIPILISLTAISVLLTFTSIGSTDKKDDPKTRHAKILKKVGLLIEEAHFSPKKIDDNLSKDLFKKYIEALDNEKCIFIKSDIEGLKKYQYTIDNEIHGDKLESFYQISNTYINRLKEIPNVINEVLSKPMNFNIDEAVQLDADKIDFCATLKDRNEFWRKKIKYSVLAKFIDLQDERSKNKSGVNAAKADSTLEREARDIVRKQLSRFYNAKILRENEEENFSVFINSLTDYMDPHSSYFPPVDLREFNATMSGRFYGIGAQLKEDDGKIIITSLVTGGPAWKSGELKENDEIIKVAQGNAEPVDVVGFTVSDAVKLIRGSEKGTVVKLTIKRVDGTIKVVSLVRDDIKLEDTFAKSAIINGNHKIGYIYLPEFYADFERPDGARCAVDVAKEIEKLKKENVEGIILDLRGNGGGSLYDVVQMAGLFVKSGPICQVKSRNDEPTLLQDKDNRIQYDGPLAVMVDGGSASASEIFAAAIQDYKRGIIIGSSSTYGKGTVQRNIPLENETPSIFDQNTKEDELGSVKLTIQKFYRINGGATQLRGVVPDIILPGKYDYLKYREKDNVTALGWDEIKKATYNEWIDKANILSSVQEINDELSKNETFAKIKSNISWLEKYTDKAYSLNITKYKADMKQYKEVFQSLDSLTKLTSVLNITNLKSDIDAVNSSSESIEKNKQWMKFRTNDLYIMEAAHSLDKLILKNMKADTGN